MGKRKGVCGHNIDADGDVEINPWQRLANAIVKQAANDYRAAAKVIDRATPRQIERARQPDPKRSSDNLRRKMQTLDECTRFFRSGWYMMLTDLDGEVLIEKLERERCERKEKKR